MVVVVVVVVRRRCAGAIIDAVAAYDKARPGQGAAAWPEFYVDNQLRSAITWAWAPAMSFL